MKSNFGMANAGYNSNFGENGAKMSYSQNNAEELERMKMKGSSRSKHRGYGVDGMKGP